jgi:hypothetical protein
MGIRRLSQFRQGIGKYKLLTSNAGVGSVVPTKWGGFVMPLSTSLWKFVNVVTEYLKANPYDELDYEKITRKLGVEFVRDKRFVSFLQKTESLPNLRCFVAIPHVSLNDYNLCETDEHPLNKLYKEANPSSKGMGEDMFTIPAVVFPRWFVSNGKRHEFKPLEEWAEIWKKNRCNGGYIEYFAPPRDPFVKTNKVMNDSALRKEKDKFEHGLLEQINMVLICPNGHISDIPWLQYFCAKLNGDGPKLRTEGFDLFNYDVSTCECAGGSHHELELSETRSRSDSFGTLKCKNCGRVVSLEGIANLQPLCPGERPWEGLGSKESAPCTRNGKRCTMKWALVTSNSVYLAENFTSLYIPDCYLNDDDALTDREICVLTLLRDKWFAKYKAQHPESSEVDYITNTSIDVLLDKADDSGHPIAKEEMQKVISRFLPVADEACDDIREAYRFAEYSVFQNNSVSSEKSKDLKFRDICLPDDFDGYFDKIQQVDVLALSCTQINFSRVEMPQPIVVDGRTIYPTSMKIFKDAPDEVYTLPANQVFGEGIFFSFNEERLDAWLKSYKSKLTSRYKNDEQHESIYDSLYYKMQKGGIPKFYLLHTFSHVIMKELEFSCGYPAASLCERLYFSDRMCGVLIYTADGSEGSMGGLVWQGQGSLIRNIIVNAMKRAANCASDPICWENDDQLNHAACFSCAMVSETSCEERNMGLDRRVLIDEEFGYFSDLLYY